MREGRRAESALKRAVLAALEQRGLDTGSARFTLLAGDGSTRLFWRVLLPGEEDSYVAMASPPGGEAATRENAAYLHIGRHLHGRGLPVAEILWHDLEQGWFLMEDLGDRSLQDAVLAGEDPLPVYSRVLEILFRLQVEGIEGFDTEWCCQTTRYDMSVMRRRESDYFRDAYLIGYLGRERSWEELERSFEHLAQTASLAESDFLIHRDFQSRNILIRRDRIGIVDWQGARVGPLGYDVASLLIDPYPGLDPSVADLLFSRYLGLLGAHDPGRVEPFTACYPYLAVQRNLQMLGAFAYLSKARGKSYFEKYIPPAVASLNRLLGRLGDPSLDALKRVAEGLDAPRPAAARG